MELTNELVNIRKERPLFNCSEILAFEPCKYYILNAGKKQFITINPNDYREIGRNEDAIFLVKKDEVLSND